MSFMYMQLHRIAPDQHGFGGGIGASVKTDGAVPRSLGTQSSRWSDSPFAVFQIDSFQGLGNIADDELVDELLRRMTVVQLMSRLKWKLSRDELLGLLAERIPE